MEELEKKMDATRQLLVNKGVPEPVLKKYDSIIADINKIEAEREAKYAQLTEFARKHLNPEQSERKPIKKISEMTPKELEEDRRRIADDFRENYGWPEYEPWVEVQRKIKEGIYKKPEDW